MRLKQLMLFLILVNAIILGVEMIYVDGMEHFINVGNLLIKVAENDLQFGAMYSHERTKVRKIGFLRIRRLKPVWMSVSRSEKVGLRSLHSI